MLSLVLAQESIVDKDTDQPVFDRAVNQRCRDCRINAAAERTQDASRTDPIADLPHRTIDEMLHRPFRAAATNAKDKVLQHITAALAVRHFRVKLYAKETPGRIGKSGYSCVGAVVSPRDLESTVRIRSLMPNCIFLVPGFGAQGRTAEEVAKCFKPDGTGAIVTASRSVIFAYNEPKFADRQDDWRGSIRQACLDFIESVRAVVST